MSKQSLKQTRHNQENQNIFANNVQEEYASTDKVTLKTDALTTIQSQMFKKAPERFNCTYSSVVFAQGPPKQLNRAVESSYALNRNLEEIQKLNKTNKVAFQQCPQKITRQERLASVI